MSQLPVSNIHRTSLGRLCAIWVERSFKLFFKPNQILIAAEQKTNFWTFKFYLQYYKFQNISIFLIAKECMCSPNRIGASFTGVFHAQSMFDFFITFPYRVFVIEGGKTRGNAQNDLSLASGIVALTSFLPRGLLSFSTNIANHCKV